jgi:hypothetical protein
LALACAAELNGMCSWVATNRKLLRISDISAVRLVDLSSCQWGFVYIHDLHRPPGHRPR